MKNWLLQNSLASALLLSACVTVPNTNPCTVKGLISRGGICHETLTGKSSDLTFQELVDMIEAQPERPDPSPSASPVPEHECGGVTTTAPCLPARGGAVIQSAEDYGKNKTALEDACRELGSRCSYEVQKSIQNMGSVVEGIR